MELTPWRPFGKLSSLIKEIEIQVKQLLYKQIPPTAI